MVHFIPHKNFHSGQNSLIKESCYLDKVIMNLLITSLLKEKIQ